MSEMQQPSQPLVTVVVPSFNQGMFLDQTLSSIFGQDVDVEVILLDAGSTDCTLEVIEKWKSRLSFWRSHSDNGQAAAINEGVARGSAPLVCWLNSDDWFLANGLNALSKALQHQADRPMVYGRVLNFFDRSQRWSNVWVQPFSARRLALRCIVSQPGTLIRRNVWEALGGVNEDLHLAMDYDLWWRIYKRFGAPLFIEDVVAVNRVHRETKTSRLRARHYAEAMDVVRTHNGKIPAKWWLYRPYSVWLKSFLNRFSS
jgi:glycosyltransferase involved in cell wall biosynthesis